MRKMVLFASLSLISLAGLSAAIAAPDSSPAAAPEVTIDSKPEQAPGTGPLTPETGGEEPTFLSGPCTVTKTCSCGTTISCTGLWDCNSGGNWVRCDSQPTKYCPSNVCQAETTCPSGQIISCSGTCNGCSNGSDSVTCGEATYTCDDCVFQFFCHF